MAYPFLYIKGPQRTFLLIHACSGRAIRLDVKPYKLHISKRIADMDSIQEPNKLLKQPFCCSGHCQLRH